MCQHGRNQSFHFTHVVSHSGKQSRFFHKLLGKTIVADSAGDSTVSKSSTSMFTVNSKPKICLPRVKVRVDVDPLALLDTFSLVDSLHIQGTF